MAAYFKDHIKASQLLTEEQYKAVLNESLTVRNSTFFKALKKSEYLTEEDLLREACTFWGLVRVADPFHTKIDFDATFKIRQSIDKVIEERQFAIILDGELTYIIADPEQESVRTAATNAFGREIKYAIITNAEYEIFEKFQLKPKQNEIASATAAREQEKAVQTRGNKLDGLETTAVQKLFDSLLTCAIDLRASDLHIVPYGDGRAEVTVRIDGEKQHYAFINSNILGNLRNRIVDLCKVGGTSPDVTVEGQINYPHKSGSIDTRITIVKAVGGYDFSFRFIVSKMRTLEELGISKRNLACLRTLSNRPTGLILFVGGVGSGKTTTEYAMIRELHERNLRVYTIEDPVEIKMPGITQVSLSKPVSKMIDYSVEAAYEQHIMHALRVDANAIVIGEIRGSAVAQSAINAADTGQLVLATMHANDAYSALPRLYDLGVSRYRAAESVSGIVAQKLVRRICPHCKEEYYLEPDSKYRKMFRLGSGQIKLWRGTGCAKCAGTGYYDRIVLCEILIVNDDIRDAIQQEMPRSEMTAVMMQSGFQSFLEDGTRKFLNGDTTPEEIEKKVYYDLRGNEYLNFIEENS